MTPFEFQLENAFDDLWTQFEKDVTAQAYPASQDDNLWFAKAHQKYAVLVFQDPYRFVCAVNRKAKSNFVLTHPFVVNLKRDQEGDEMLVQGISKTGLVNVHLNGDLLKNLLVGVAAALDGLEPFDKARIASLAKELDALNPLPNPCKPQITVAAEFSKVFTHVSLGKGSAASLAVTVGNVFGYLLSQPQKVADWLTKGQQERNYFPDPKNPVQISPDAIQYDGSNEVDEILYIGASDARSGATETCFCMTNGWVNGQPVEILEACAKPYAD